MSELMILSLNPKRYQERYYWTLKEILDPTDIKKPYGLSNADILTIANSMSGYSTPLIVNSNWANANYGKVLDLVVKRLWNHYVFYTSSEEFDSEKQKEFILNLLNVLEMTSERYLTLLKAYSDSKDLLLSPVKTTITGLNRFNDTPQDEGDFASDEHTTNLTEISNVTENDLDSKMGRIREIESSYNNLLLIWSNEFEPLFIEEENI